MIKHDLPFADYLNSPGISASQIKILSDCPRKYKHFIVDKNQPVDTPAMKFGRAFHTYVLEPELFAEEYMIKDKVKGCGPVWKEKEEALCGKTILFSSELDDIQKMKESLLSNGDIAPYLNSFEPEVSMFWSLDKIECRGRADGIKKNGGKVAIFDIKTTLDASPDGFSREIFKRKYDMQAAFYMDGYEKITGIMPEVFLFFAVEKSAPFLEHAFALPKDCDAISRGRSKYKEALREYEFCKENNKWERGYGEATSVIVPPWV